MIGPHPMQSDDEIVAFSMTQGFNQVVRGAIMVSGWSFAESTCRGDGHQNSLGRKRYPVASSTAFLGLIPAAVSVNLYCEKS